MGQTTILNIIPLATALSRPPRFAGGDTASNHFVHLLGKSIGAQRKFTIGGLFDFIQISKLKFMTKKFSVRHLPFFIGVTQAAVKLMRC
jgi:hypothetical protein